MAEDVDEIEETDEECRRRNDEFNAEFNARPTREAKLAFLKEHMSEGMAEDAIGIMLGEHNGDRIVID